MNRLNGSPFRLGINYWPARTAMGWWSDFDQGEVAADFQRIAGCGFDSVRIFLTWEAFQPSVARIDPVMTARLVATLDEANRAGLSLMPTLFTGHMSGVNWIPGWALGAVAGDVRFRVVSADHVTGSRLADWYTDPVIAKAQAWLAGELAFAVAGHPSLLAWDLGNENSNCVVPRDKSCARDWLLRMSGAIRVADGEALVTLGLHMEDLEQDRGIGPREAAEVCDFLTMHGYPGYAAWAEGPTDERLLPFLTRMTHFLGGGVDVLFSEFGVPTRPHAAPSTPPTGSAAGPALVAEADAATYIERGLDALLACGSTGAMLWCYTDYASAIWGIPPLDLAPHERSFGLWRADGSPKPAVAVIEAFANGPRAAPAVVALADTSWLDVDAGEFYRMPAVHLPRLYQRYCSAAARLNGSR